MLKKLKPSTDILWPLIALSGYVFVVSIMPVSPNDFWWHLKIGEWIRQNGQIPTTNLFAWTLPADQPYFYAAWLSEYLLYGVYLLGNLSAVMFTRNLLVLTILLLWMVETHRQSGSWRLTTLTVILGGGMILNNLAIRPALFSVLAFMVFVTVLNRYRDGQLLPGWLILCPVVMALWVNLHGAFILGLVLLGLTALGEGIRAYSNQAGTLAWRQLGWLTLSGAGTFVATFVNPRGAAIWSYVFGLSTSGLIQQINREWHPPAPTGLSNTLFFASILILLVVFVYSRYRPTLTEIFLLVSFLWLAWTSQRHVIWYAILVVPIMVKAIQRLPVGVPQFSSQRNWLNLALVGLFFVPAIMVQPWWIERFPLPDAYWEIVYRDEVVGPLVGQETPLRAVDYLQDHPGGKLFHDAGYGSYLIWALPNQGVFVDPRVELYPEDLWTDYLDISAGIHYDVLLAKYGVDRLLLNVDQQPDLIQSLKTDPGWQIEYQDQRMVIYAKLGR